MSAQINAEYQVTAREVNIATHGLAFLTIAGTHVNGGYAAFPEFGLTAELSPSDLFYNTNKLFGMLRACGDPLLPKQDEALNEIAKDLSGIITPLINSLALDPGQDEGKRINGGYEIIESCTIGNTELVIGHNPNAPDPYVCWNCYNSIEYINGFYCQTLAAAREKISKRYIDVSLILEGLDREKMRMQSLQDAAKDPLAEDPPEAQAPPRRHVSL